MTMTAVHPTAEDRRQGGVPAGEHFKTQLWGRAVGIAAVAASLLLGGWTLGHDVFPPATTDQTSGMTDVDLACVAVLHNGGMPDDCSRMYHLLPIP